MISYIIYMVYLILRPSTSINVNVPSAKANSHIRMVNWF